MKRLLLLITICISSVSFGQVPSYVPTNGLVGWWGFNGNANDESGNGNNGTVNGPVLTTDRFGNPNSAYDFDGVDDYIIIPDSPGFDFGPNDFSVLVWFLPEEVTGSGSSCVPDDNGLIVSMWQTGGSPGANEWLLYSDYPGNNASFRIEENTTSYFVEGQSDFSNSLNMWSQLIGVVESDSMKIYVNGVLEAASFIGNPSVNSTGIDLLLGTINEGLGTPLCNVFSNLQIDDIGIWNRSLTQCEISALYNAQTLSNPIVDLGGDTLIVCGITTVLDATYNSSSSYSWSNGETTPSISVNSSGLYSVAVTDTNGCIGFDTTLVSILDPTITASAETICLGDSTLLQVPSSGNTYYDTVLVDQFTMTFNSAYSHNSPITNVGTQYLIKVQGDFRIWSCCTNSGTGAPRLDAAYYFATDNSDTPYERIQWCWNGVTPVTDVTLFRPDNDVYNNNHVYWFSFDGDGLTQNFCFTDGAYGDNNGSLQFEIYKLQPQLILNNFLWSTGDTTLSISVQPTQTTTYSVTVTDGISSCVDDVTITVNDPQVEAGVDVDVCNGDDITLSGAGTDTYAWSGGVTDGVAFAPTTSEYYYVTGTDALGCEDIDSVFVNILQPTTSSITEAVCETYTAPDGATYTSTGTYTAVIPNAAGCDSTITLDLTILSPSSSTDTQEECEEFTWIDGNTYTESNNTATFVIPNAVGCDSTITLNLTINNLTSLDAGVDQTVCEGTDVTLTATGAASYAWSGGVSNGTPFPAEAGTTTYTVEGTDANGCTDQQSVNVTGTSYPELVFDVTNPACQGEASGSITAVVNNGTSPFGFLWSNGVLQATNENIGSGSYSVTVTDNNGCESSGNVVVVDPSEPCFFISDGISPNGDGANDTWMINGLSSYPDAKVSVFNRWGQEVYSGTANSAPWDGTDKGKELPTADYYYVLDLGNGDTYNGIVTLKK